MGWQKKTTSAEPGFQTRFSQMSQALRGSIHAAEQQQVVLRCICLECIPGAFRADRGTPKARWAQATSFLNDRLPNLKADDILANPPFNMKEWGGERLREDKRWKFGVPPVRNANFAWVQHIVHHLAPIGYAGFVLANGSMSSNQSGEGGIRKNIIEADLVDCMVALPGQLFYSTQIPACLWFLASDKSGRPPAGQKNPLRDRRGEVLFIDARKMGRMVDRTHRELTDEEIQRIAQTYHAWRGEVGADGRPPEYEDIPGFGKSATLEEIRKHSYVLTPGRYIGGPEQDKHDALFDSKIAWACHNDTTGNPRGADVFCCSCTSLDGGAPKLVLLRLPSTIAEKEANSRHDI